MKPQIIKDQEQKLVELLEKDALPTVSVSDAASFLGIHPSTLRRSLYTGRSPLGFGIEGDLQRNGYSVIPKLSFYNFLIKGTSE